MIRQPEQYNGITLVQVNATKAKRLYKEGVTVYLIQSKARINGLWVTPYEMTHDINSMRITRAIDFDGIVTAYKHYNCSHQLGQRVHFLVDIKNQ